MKTIYLSSLMILMCSSSVFSGDLPGSDGASSQQRAAMRHLASGGASNSNAASVNYIDSALVEGDNEGGIGITAQSATLPTNTTGTRYSNSAHVKGNNKGGIKLGK